MFNELNPKVDNIYPTFRFKIIVDDVYNVLFREFRLPSLKVNLDTFKEGGQNQYAHQLPKTVTPGNVIFRQGITRDMTIMQWYLDVMTGNFKNIYRQVTVNILDAHGDNVLSMNFRNAYPIRWSGPVLKSDNSEVAIEEIELVYHEILVNTR